MTVSINAKVDTDIKAKLIPYDLVNVTLYTIYLELTSALIIKSSYGKANNAMISYALIMMHRNR